jgi:ribonucleoside-diphosphate reductase alpha chain
MSCRPSNWRCPSTPNPMGDICPDCGEASFLNVEGCRKCHICGYSEC